MQVVAPDVQIMQICPACLPAHPTCTFLAPAAWLLAGYGPVDQGAFNQYYEKEVKGKPISKVSGWAKGTF